MSRPGGELRGLDSVRPGVGQDEGPERRWGSRASVRGAGWAEPAEGHVEGVTGPAWRAADPALGVCGHGDGVGQCGIGEPGSVLQEPTAKLLVTPVPLVGGCPPPVGTWGPLRTR